jgi:hypothetical protein
MLVPPRLQSVRRVLGLKPLDDQRSALLEPVLGLLPKHLLCGCGRLRQCQRRLINQHRVQQQDDEQAVLHKHQHLQRRCLQNLKQPVPVPEPMGKWQRVLKQQELVLERSEQVLPGPDLLEQVFQSRQAGRQLPRCHLQQQ